MEIRKPCSQRTRWKLSEPLYISTKHTSIALVGITKSRSRSDILYFTQKSWDESLVQSKCKSGNIDALMLHQFNDKLCLGPLASRRAFWMSRSMAIPMGMWMDTQWLNDTSLLVVGMDFRHIKVMFGHKGTGTKSNEIRPFLWNHWSAKSCPTCYCQAKYPGNTPVFIQWRSGCIHEMSCKCRHTLCPKTSDLRGYFPGWPPGILIKSQVSHFINHHSRGMWHPTVDYCWFLDSLPNQICHIIFRSKLTPASG